MAVFDEQWFPFLSAHIDTEFDTFNDLVYITPENRQRFIEGKDEQPVMTPLGAVSRVDTEAGKQLWTDFLTAVQRQEAHPVVRDLYEKKISRQLLRIELTEDAYQKDGALFTQHTQELYGRPADTFVVYVAERLKTLIAEATGDIAADAKSFFKPLLKLASADTGITPALLPAVVDSEDYIDTAEEVYELFLQYVAQAELPGWEVVIDTTGNKRIFSVGPTSQRIYIPDTKFLTTRKKRLTRIGVEAIAAHEIGVHAKRVANGKQSSLQLLSYGLYDYLRGEEGAATYLQQTVEGADEFYGFDRYLAIMLATGVDGLPRAFREVFEGMRYYYLLAEKAGTSCTQSVFDHATNTAFLVTQRVFRGTTGMEPGVVYTRDLAYLEGNIGMWQLLTDQPEMLQYLTLGKYDMLNPEHVSALMTLGIIGSE